MEYQDSLLDEALSMEDKLKKATIRKASLKCTKCNRAFTLASNLTRHKRHNKICGISNGFECPNCHKVFSLNASMKDHYERCIAEDPYRFPCPHCPKQFTFKSSLNKHLRGRCRTLKKNSQNRELFTCKFCAAEFYDAYVCQSHVKSGMCTAENAFTTHICPHCARSFTMKSSLTKHLKGRCKLLKVGNEFKTEYLYQTSSSNNDTDDVEVYEEWFEPEDVIEECDDEADEILSDEVETYIEISNENIVDEVEKLMYESSDDISSSSLKNS